MKSLRVFNEQLSEAEKHLIDSLQSPFQIQVFLDDIPYPSGDENRSVLQVLRQRKAHCLDGGLFAAAALHRLGHPALIMDMQPEPGRDDDHVLALYKHRTCWGAVAKSNYSGLRFREPIFRTLRELVLSYFEDFFNTKGEKTLRSYSRPINLARFDHLNWMTEPQGVDRIEDYLKTIKVTLLLNDEQINQLSPVDRRSFEAGTLGINHEGAFKPS